MNSVRAGGETGWKPVGVGGEAVRMVGGMVKNQVGGAA
jgi:hypothetical protein